MLNGLSFLSLASTPLLLAGSSTQANALSNETLEDWTNSLEGFAESAQKSISRPLRQANNLIHVQLPELLQGELQPLDALVLQIINHLDQSITIDYPELPQPDRLNLISAMNFVGGLQDNRMTQGGPLQGLRLIQQIVKILRYNKTRDVDVEGAELISEDLALVPLLLSLGARQADDPHASVHDNGYVAQMLHRVGLVRGLMTWSDQRFHSPGVQTAVLEMFGVSRDTLATLDFVLGIEVSAAEFFHEALFWQQDPNAYISAALAVYLDEADLSQSERYARFGAERFSQSWSMQQTQAFFQKQRRRAKAPPQSLRQILSMTASDTSRLDRNQPRLSQFLLRAL